jgi:hypothetical protein
MTRENINILGMPLEQWKHKSCTANFGIGSDWATLYDIKSEDQGKGHATELLIEAKKYYGSLGKKLGGTVAMNDRMKYIYKKLDILEYDN